MALVEWTDRLTVNVKEIDDQHKKFVEMINTLHAALLANRGPEVHKAVLDDLLEYATVHFETEEKYMVQFGFVGYEEHKEKHRAFTDEAFRLQRTYAKTGFLLTPTILRFLTNWLEDHLLTVDKEYVECFTANWPASQTTIQTA